MAGPVRLPRLAADERIIAHWCDSFQGDVAGSLDGPFVVLLEQDCADEPGDGGFVGEDPDDVGAALDLAVEALEHWSSAAWSGGRRGRSCRRGRRPQPRPSGLRAWGPWAGAGRRRGAIAPWSHRHRPGRRRWR